MAQPTNTYDTYDMKGIREDLRDVIYDISPVETPFLSNIGKGTCRNTYHEWQIDSLAAASTSNAVIEGDDATTDAQTSTTRRGNYTQIMDKVILVTGTSESVERAGRDSELGYLLAKAGKELKRDLEATLTANQARVAGNATTARKFASLGAWVKTNDVIGGTGSPAGASPTGDGTDARTDAGTKAALTEANLNTAIRNAWTQGGEPNMIMVGPVNKVKITAFVGNATKYKDVSDRKVVNAVDIYESDFGQLTVVPNRFQRETDCWVLDTDMWDVVYLPGREFKVNDLAKTGDSERKQMLVECTLVSKNEAASAMVADCTTS